MVGLVTELKFCRLVTKRAVLNQLFAKGLVEPVKDGWFTEGFDTLDLREAKALLEELAS